LSTNLKHKKDILPLRVMWASLWILACSIAWKGSSLSGGEHSKEAIEIAILIGENSHLTKRCIIKAAESIKVQFASYRPTIRYLRNKEQMAIDKWHDAGCPDRAVPGISYGVKKFAREAISARKL
jgi:hypothetical protein